MFSIESGLGSSGSVASVVGQRKYIHVKAGCTPFSGRHRWLTIHDHEYDVAIEARQFLAQRLAVELIAASVL